jgi:outer membrane protein
MLRAAGCLLVGAVCLLSAASAPAEPLTDALVRAYLASPRLEAGRAGLRAVDEAVARARAARRPFLTATSSIAGALASSEGGAGLESQRQSLSVTQSLYSGGETGAAIARAENAVRAERARLQALEQSVLLDAVTAYVGLARAEAVLGLARGNEERLRLQLDATQDRERFGDVTRTDIAQARTRFARATAGRIAAEGERASAVAEYRRIIGEEPAAALRLPPPADGLPASAAEAAALASNGWDYQAADFDLAAARDEVDVALAGLKPRLSLSGAVSYAEERGSTRDAGGDAVVGATLAVPLYQGGGEHARVRQSKELLRQKRHGRDDALRTTEAGIARAFEAMRTAEAVIRSLQTQADAAGFAVEGVRQEALVGARAVLDVLDAEEELFRAETDLARAEAERVLSSYRLRAAIGRLTARDLALPVAFQDPEAHYRDVEARWWGLGDDVGED